jgi:hypothetical protein
VALLRTRTLFAPLRGDPELEARLDYRKAAEAEAAIGIAEWEASTSDPEPLVAATQALRALDRPRDALELAQRGLETVEAANPEGLHDARRLFLQEIGYAQYELQESEPARKSLERAAAISERGHSNVSQVINRAANLMFDSLPEQALAVLVALGPASPYGTMWADATRVCAYEQLGRSEERDAVLAEMAPREDDHPVALAQALLCASRIDDAAALMVRRLSNSDHQEAAFSALHKTEISPVDERPFPRLLHGRFDPVRQRPEVQAAAAALGTPEQIPLVGVYWPAF